MSVFSKFWFWLIIVGVLLVLFALLAYFAISSISNTLAIILGGVGLFMIIGGIIWYVADKKNQESPKQPFEAKIQEAVSQQLEKVPRAGEVAGNINTKIMRGAGTSALYSATTLNKGITEGTNITGSVIQKGKRAVIIGILTSGAGEGVSASGLASGVAKDFGQRGLQIATDESSKYLLRNYQ